MLSIRFEKNILHQDCQQASACSGKLPTGKKWKKLFGFLIISVLIFVSCTRNPLKVNISGIKEEVKIVRFDRELFALPMADTLAGLTALRSSYPAFFDLFTWKVIEIGGIDEEHFPEAMGEFLADSMILDLNHLVEKEFSTFQKTE